MPKLRTLSGRELLRIFAAFGIRSWLAVSLKAGRSIMFMRAIFLIVISGLPE